MQTTSFGSLEKILETDGKVRAEYLVFEKEGRNHQHKEFENFTVLSGKGQVVCGDKTIDVKPGDIVTIPPFTDHRMIPATNEFLTGLLWYQDVNSQHFQ